MKLLVLKGDGIGPEIMASALDVLETISKKINFKLDLHYEDIGYSALQKFNTTFPKHILSIIKNFDGIILGPVDHNNYPSENNGGLNPSGLLRKNLKLYSNIRPAKSYKGVNSLVNDMDIIIVRENTEGFYSDRNMYSGKAEFEVENGIGISIRKITKKASDKIANRAFQIAKNLKKNRKINVHAIHKANIFRLTDGIFLKSCRKASKNYPKINYHEMLVDAATAHLVRDSSKFDIIITTNMFGDILSDLASELSGSLGLSGSLNVGDSIPMAQAQHGAATDIMNKGIANPISLILSTAMLFEWLGYKKNIKKYSIVSKVIKNVIDHVLNDKDFLTPDLGGCSTTIDLTNEIKKRIINYE